MVLFHLSTVKVPFNIVFIFIKLVFFFFILPAFLLCSQKELVCDLTSFEDMFLWFFRQTCWQN